MQTLARYALDPGYGYTVRPQSVTPQNRRGRVSQRAKELLYAQFDKWGYDERGWTVNTRIKYLRRARAADAWLQANRGTAVFYASQRDLKEYLFATKPSPYNRNGIRQALVGLGEFTVDRGMRQDNPALALKRLPQPQSLPKALTLEQTQRILAVAPLFGEMENALTVLLACTGLRATEARTLEWPAVTDGWLRFRGKGGKERVVPIKNGRAGPVMAAWRAQATDPRWVFPSRQYRSRPVGETWLRRLVKDIGRAAGVPDLHPHLFRHTCATLLMESGAELRDVQEWLGHSDPRTTSIYTKVRPARLEEAGTRLALTLDS